MIKSKEYYLYFPECTISKVHSVLQPQNNIQILTFHIKSLTNTPEHYPKHELIEGKAEFYFRLVCSLNFLKNRSQNYEELFGFKVGYHTKLKSKHVSVVAKLSDVSEIKLETIGLGKVNEFMTVFNDDVESFIPQINLAAQLEYKLTTNVEKQKIIKI